nr:hypothetical protein [Tanacetum cinerariifolium]
GGRLHHVFGGAPAARCGHQRPQQRGRSQPQRRERHRHFDHHAICTVPGNRGRAHPRRGARQGQPGGGRIPSRGGRGRLPGVRRHFVERGHLVGGGRGLHVGVIFQDLSPGIRALRAGVHLGIHHLIYQHLRARGQTYAAAGFCRRHQWPDTAHRAGRGAHRRHQPPPHGYLPPPPLDASRRLGRGFHHGRAERAGAGG